jgi:hypothetical protein
VPEGVESSKKKSSLLSCSTELQTTKKLLLQKKALPTKISIVVTTERFYSFFLSVLYFSRDAAHGIILIIITDYERRYLCV